MTSHNHHELPPSAQSSLTNAFMILVVDDLPGNRLLLSRLLARVGYQTIEAPDGESALIAMDKSQPDLVILDVEMPGIDGIETVEKLRLDEQSKAGKTENERLPVIVASGNASDEISLADRVDLEWTGDDSITLTCSDATIPTGEENLATMAVRALEERTGKNFSLRIHIEKRIPSAAGLGGGSSDAAAVLRGLNKMGKLNLSVQELEEVAAGIGSDVPFFVCDSAICCDCTGRGEIVTPVTEFKHELPILLIKPAFDVSAGWAYQKFESSKELPTISYLPQICPWGTMVNDLERPVFQKHIVLARMKTWLLSQKEVHAALMSGSGSTMLVVLNPDSVSSFLKKRISERFGESTWMWAGRSI